mgnify:CR=1 FL=1
MRNVHPSPTGGLRYRQPQRVAEHPDENEEDLFRCYQCGFWNERSEIVIGDAADDMAGLQKTTVVEVAGAASENVIEIDESVQHGCVFCKSLNSDGHSLSRDRHVKSPFGFRGYR